MSILSLGICRLTDLFMELVKNIVLDIWVSIRFYIEVLFMKTVCIRNAVGFRGQTGLTANSGCKRLDSRKGVERWGMKNLVLDILVLGRCHTRLVSMITVCVRNAVDFRGQTGSMANSS